MSINREFLELLRARLSIVDVVGRTLPLVRKGMNHWACCPFHGEKTPSFSVNENKGYYHCFGCGAHGDIITFVMQTQNLSFIEAVERLAMDAGLEMPKLSPEDREKNKLSHDIYEVVALACDFFQKTLREKDGAAGLAYLQKRRLSEDLIANFRLGFAPNSSYGEARLVHYLENKGVSVEKIIAAGLAKKSEKDGSVYDYFRNRVMFPIMDSRGRPIAFGGRVMDDSEPKYLNSPETPIFSKGRGLYGLCQAREHVSPTSPPIATEGYTDTIALHKFGFNTALAPLGTALTEEQMLTLWKLHDEPILCFDSDTAGRNAGVRAALRALPILKPGKSLRFCLMEGAKDPDEFLHAFGVERMRDMLLNKSVSLSDMLWGYFTNGKLIKTPEQRSGLEAAINKELSLIKDESVRKFYADDFKARAREAFGAVRKAPSAPAPRANPENPNERMILAFAICYPVQFAKYIEKGAVIEIKNKRLKAIFDIVRAEAALRPHTRETMLALLHEKNLKPESMLSFEIESIVGKPDTAKKILDERILILARDSMSAELKNLSSGILRAAPEEVAGMQAKIRAISDELLRIQDELEKLA